jgi:prepilin-type N-terminal cleavage/methylation domain
MLMFLKKVKREKKGYTLTELIVVVAILGILAVVATPMILNQVQKARTNTDAINEKAIENAYAIGIAEATTSGTPADASVASIIQKTLKEIPEPNDKSKDFYINAETGQATATVSASAPSGWVKLN